MTTNDFITYLSEAKKALNILRPIAMEIKKYEIKVQKINFILDPRFDLNSSVEKKSGNTYLQAKVYWPNKDGKNVRSLTISLGNMINYPLGKKHPDTIAEVKKEIQNILIKKFGNVI